MNLKIETIQSFAISVLVLAGFIIPLSSNAVTDVQIEEQTEQKNEWGANL